MKHVLPLFLFSATALFAQPVIPGAWTIDGDIQGYTLHETCTFTQANDKISGPCTNADGKTYDTVVTLVDQKVVFVHAGEYEGQALTLTFTGTLNDKGELAGDIYVDPLAVDGTFTAKKTDKKAETEAKPETK
jgi:hypothetical protein